MATESGLGQHSEILVAHLLTENGALAEDRHGDQGCSLGIIQWNTCIHNGQSVKNYIRNNPKMAIYENQILFYLQEIKKMKEKYGTIELAIAHWNWGARPYYLNKVKSNISWAKQLLYD
jgi:hypothetical protein